jgi:FkbM family methyltransferase
MNVLTRMARRILLSAIGRKRMGRWIVAVARLAQIDLLHAAYRDRGILNYENQTVSGEKFVLREILPRLVTADEPVMFDVGANIGDVSRALRAEFPRARIWAFEPNPVTFAILEKNLGSSKIACQRLGFGAESAAGVLHSYAHDQASGHATMYPEMFEIYGDSYGVKGADRLTTFEFPIGTIDSYCEQNGIRRIDFLKIDVEGHELSVLEGASRLVNTGNVDVIQFEFTDCNVLSRVFLRDFYECLPQYRFYRLNTAGLIPLGVYKTRNEIFQFQNILAMREGLAPLVSGFMAAEQE